MTVSSDSSVVTVVPHRVNSLFALERCAVQESVYVEADVMTVKYAKGRFGFFVGHPADWGKKGVERNAEGHIELSALDLEERLGFRPPLLSDYLCKARSRGVTVFVDLRPMESKLPLDMLRHLVEMIVQHDHVATSFDRGLLEKMRTVSKKLRIGLFTSDSPSQRDIGYWKRPHLRPEFLFGDQWRPTAAILRYAQKRRYTIGWFVINEQDAGRLRLIHERMKNSPYLVISDHPDQMLNIVSQL